MINVFIDYLPYVAVGFVVLAVAGLILIELANLFSFSSPEATLTSFGVLYLFFARAVLRTLSEHDVPCALILTAAPPILLFSLAGMTNVMKDRLSQFRQKSKDHSAAMLWKSVSQGTSDENFSIYLRPFSLTNQIGIDDTPKLPSGQRQVLDYYGVSLSHATDFEALLAQGFQSFSKLVCLGLPGEAVGAGRVAANETEWRDVVLQLMKNAQSIVLVPSIQSGTLWEIEHIKKYGYLHKTILVRPPRLSDNEWNRTSERLAHHDIGWNTNGIKAGLFTLDKSGVMESYQAFPSEVTTQSIASCLVELLNSSGRSLESTNEPRTSDSGEMCYWCEAPLHNDDERCTKCDRPV